MKEGTRSRWKNKMDISPGRTSFKPSVCSHLMQGHREKIWAPRGWICISSSFPNTAAESRRLQKCVLRHCRKNSLERGFWMLLSVGGADLASESVGPGKKHSPQESFVLRNWLLVACKTEGAMRMVLKLFINPESGEEKKLDLMVFYYSFYLLCM